MRGSGLVVKKTKKRSNLTLRQFFVLGFLFVAIIPAALLGMYQTVSSAWALENLEEKDLMRSLRSASTLVETYFENHENKARTLANLLEERPMPDTDRSYEDVVSLFKQFLTADMGFSEWRLLNTRGKTTVSYPSSQVGIEYHQLQWFKEMLDKPEVKVITNILEPKYNRDYVCLAIPMFNEGNMSNVLLGYIKLDYIGDLLLDTINYPVIIADEQGYNLFARDSLKEDTFQLNALLAKGINQFTPEWIEEEGSQFLSAYHKIPLYNWHVIVEKPQEQIRKHWQDRLVISFLGVLLMIFFMFALAPWFKRLIFNPLANLHAAFRSITDQETIALMDENQEVEEFLEIARDFNTMVQRFVDMLDEREKDFISGIESLSKAIEFRDKYTGGHSQRVAEYAVLIAKEMNLDDDQVEQIRIAGLLHDIGKIGVPGAILNKPGALTDEEWEKIKRHPAIAVEILSTGPFKDLAPHIRSHHERYDGKGYPDGLKGEEISLIAQILGVADAFDAMTTDRVYRSKMTIEQAKEELVKNRGLQFSPKVVDATLALIDKEILNNKDGLKMVKVI